MTQIFSKSIHDHSKLFKNDFEKRLLETWQFHCITMIQGRQVSLLHLTTLVQGSTVPKDFPLFCVGSDMVWCRLWLKKFILNLWYQRIDFRFRYLESGFKRRISIYFGNESMNIEVFYCEGVLELWDSRLIISTVLIR